MSHLLHRKLRQAPPLAVRAAGIRLVDSTGRSYIDAGGVGVGPLGHGHPDVIAAMQRQLGRCDHAPAALFGNEAAEELAAHLVAGAPPDFGGVALAAGGTQALEMALALARQYWVEAGEPQRRLFMARRQGWHAGTAGAPLPADTVRIGPCYEYRGRAAHQSTADYTAGLLDELETRILATGPDNIIAFVAEPVVGTTGGAVPPTPGYFQGVRDICDRYRILLVADETLCGMGRTGTMYALEQDGVAPDIVAVAQGLGASGLPLGAVLAHQAIVDCLRQGSGVFGHGQAGAGQALAAAAALAAQKVIERDGLLGRVRSRGATLRRMLGDVFGTHEHVGDIRGRGMFLALEFVQDRATKTPFPPERRLHAAVKTKAMENGLLVCRAGGTSDGEQGDHVLLAPPFIATAADLSEIVSRLADAVEAALHA